MCPKYRETTHAVDAMSSPRLAGHHQHRASIPKCSSACAWPHPRPAATPRWCRKSPIITRALQLDEDSSDKSSSNDVDEGDEELIKTFSLPQSLVDRNSALVKELRGELILAPLTRANHLPFRRWVREMGCRVTMSEMAFARTLLKWVICEDRA